MSRNDHWGVIFVFQGHALSYYKLAVINVSNLMNFPGLRFSSLDIPYDTHSYSLTIPLLHGLKNSHSITMKYIIRKY